MKTGIEILVDNDKEATKELLEKLKVENIPFNDPKLHDEILGYSYNKGDFEKDETNAIKRIMVELKILSVWGKHSCPQILLKR